MNHPDGGAMLHFRTFTAGGNLFFQRALANPAQAFAEDSLTAVGAAAVAVDMFRQYGGVVQLGPQSGGLFAQGLVVVAGGEVGVALFAVDASIGNHVFHGNSVFILRLKETCKPPLYCDTHLLLAETPMDFS